MGIQGYRDLRVWGMGMELAVECYRLAKRLPRYETYALGDQIRRSAVSVPANIAEGHESDHLGDYLRSLSAARRSLAELETLLSLAEMVSYFEPADVAGALKSTDDISRMLSGLSKKLRKGTRFDLQRWIDRPPRAPTS
jgi:four helix bundle protein